MDNIIIFAQQFKWYVNFTIIFKGSEERQIGKTFLFIVEKKKESKGKYLTPSDGKQEFSVHAASCYFRAYQSMPLLPICPLKNGILIISNLLPTVTKTKEREKLFFCI